MKPSHFCSPLGTVLRKYQVGAAKCISLRKNTSGLLFSYEADTKKNCPQKPFCGSVKSIETI